MPPCESTLGYINLAPSDCGAVGCIIDLTGSDSEGGEHAPVEEEVEGTGKEDLEEHRVVEESIESARRVEEEVHCAVEDSFESLREDRVRAWLRAKNKGMKVAASLQITASRFDDAIREVWMSVAARHKAVWEARTAASMSGCNNHFVGEGQRSTIQKHQATLPQAPAGVAKCSTVKMHQAALAPARAAL
jgi:hypothetical protein